MDECLKLWKIIINIIGIEYIIYIDISNRYMYMIDKGYDVKVNIINDLLVNS